MEITTLFSPDNCSIGVKACRNWKWPGVPIYRIYMVQYLVVKLQKTQLLAFNKFVDFFEILRTSPGPGEF